jgi:hypothetical protein
MKQRKYTNVHVVRNFYCSSSQDYFATVRWVEDGKHRSGREFWINQNAFLGKGRRMEWWTAPKYLIHEVEQALWQAVESGDYIVYEYDRDHEKRFKNLRYHMPNYLKRMVGVRVGVNVPYERDEDPAESEVADAAK